MSRNLEELPNWINRHKFGMPEDKCLIEILYRDFDGVHEYECFWEPFDEENYIDVQKPDENYLGTATKTEQPFKGIGFHAWAGRDSEFVHYRVVNHDVEL